MKKLMPQSASATALFAFSVTVFLLWPGFCRGEQARAVGLVVSSSSPLAEMERPGLRTLLLVRPGMAVFEGDQIRNRGGTTDIGWCPQRSLLTIQGNGVVTFDATGMRMEGTPVVTRSVPVCSLPAMRRDAMPRNLSIFSRGQVKAGASSGQDEAGGSSAAVAETESPPRLLVAVDRAVRLEQAKDWTGALEEYRRIRMKWPDAEWCREAIARMHESRLQSASVASKPPGGSPGSVYAFVVGISNYRSPRINPLHYADHDATLFADFLSSPRGGGMVLDETLFLRTNAEATMDRLTTDLASFLDSKATGNSTLIVYLAGHGIYACRERSERIEQADPCRPGQGNEEPYFLAWDSDPEDPKVSAIRVADLYDLVASNADRFGKVLLYLDICHSGAVGAFPLQSLLTSREVESVLPRANPDVAFMLASSRLSPKDRNDEYAIEDLRFGDGHGLFTYMVVRGENGDLPGDQTGVIRLPQLMDFVRTNVRYQSNNRQTPSYSSTRPEIEIVSDTARPGIEIADLAGEKRAIVPRQSWLADSYAGPDPRAQRYKAPPPSSRVVSEQQGQAVMLRYLLGEQIPQTQKEFEAAAGSFREALDLVPDSGFDESRMLFCQGRFLVFAKRYSEAQETLERAIRIDPNRGYAFNALGIAFLEQSVESDGNLQRARAAFEDAIRLSPYWAYPVHNLALTLEQSGLYEAAIEQYRNAIRMTPLASYPAYNLGLLYQKLNRVTEAREMYETAIRTASEARPGMPAGRDRWPNLSDGYSALGTLLAAEGKFSAAEKQFRSALDLDQTNLIATHNLAVLLAQKRGGSKEAISRWTSIFEVAPGGDEAIAAHISLAEEFVRRRSPQDAIRQYREALKIRPAFGAVSRALAILLTETGDLAAAISETDHAIGLFSDPILRVFREDLTRLKAGQQPQDHQLREIYRHGTKSR
jgi:tetratricopeptide (TPR) repeat protein/uncharacterized caspase-like protein